MAEPEAFSMESYGSLSTAGVSMPKSPFLLSAFLCRNEITKLDNVCYNDSLLVSFLPLWAPSVNVCLLKTGPEACHFYGVGLVLNQVRDSKLYGRKCITFEHYYNEKARIVQSDGGRFLRFPPDHNQVWHAKSLPVTTTDNSSLKESLSTHTALFYTASLMVGGPLPGRCYYNYSRHFQSVNNDSKDKV
jgi:hypothetical protein